MTSNIRKRPASSRGGSERGVALVFTLLVLAVLTVMGVGLVGMGVVATTVTVNESETKQALAIADAGISHAKKLILWQEWASFNQFLQNGDGTACTGDELTAAPAAPLPPGYPVAAADFIPAAGRAFGGGTYRVFVCDDDLTDVDPVTLLLDANPNADVNKRILVRSIGTGPNGATAAAELVIAGQSLPAVLINGNTLVTGTPRIMGPAGAVHANGTLSLAGNACAQQYYSAVGTVPISGNSVGGGAGCTNAGVDTRPDSAPINMPVLNPDDYKSLADYWLEIDGTAYNGATGLPIPVPVGWSFNAGSKVWSSNSNILAGTYWINGNVAAGGSPGSSGSPLPLSLLAKGYIDISGSPRTVPKLTIPVGGAVIGVSAIAGTDLRLSGNSSVLYTGLYYAVDQLDVAGTPTVNGQLLALNKEDVAYPAGSANNLLLLDASGNMVISGSPTVNFTGGSAVGAAPVQWRECRTSTNPNNPCGALFGG